MTLNFYHVMEFATIFAWPDCPKNTINQYYPWRSDTNISKAMGLIFVQ
jgi:hypothetical protein